MAIEGFTGSLAFELEAFNVQVKLVEPGYGPTTRFTSNGGSGSNPSSFGRPNADTVRSHLPIGTARTIPAPRTAFLQILRVVI